MLKLLIKILLNPHYGSKRVHLLGLTFALSLTTLITVTGIDTQFNKAVNQLSSESMGGELRLSSSTPITLDLKRFDSVEMTHVIRMPTVTFFHDKTQMLTLNAVENNYPVSGTIDRTPESASLQEMETWIQEPLSRMSGLTVGDRLPIGKDLLKVTGIVHQSPDQRPLSLNLAPNIWVSHETLSALGLLMPASRAQYLYYFQCNSSDCRTLYEALEPTLLPGQTLTNPEDRITQINKSTEQFQRLILLLAFMSCFAALVALLYSTYQYINAQQYALEIITQLGALPGQIIGSICLAGCILLLPITIISLLVSYILQISFTHAFSQWVVLPPPHIDLAQTLIIVMMLISLVMPVIIPCALKAFERTNKVKETMGCLIGILLFYTFLSLTLKGFEVTLTFLGGLFVFLTLLTSLFMSLIIFQKHVFQFRNVWSFITQAKLFFYKTRYAFLLSTYTMLTTTCLAAASVSIDSIHFWSQQLNTPSFNYFAINIPKSSSDTLQSWFTEKQVSHSDIYPMIKARLIKKNNQPIMDQLSPEQQSFNALHRSINISYSHSLPDDNTLTKGTWPTQKNEWSIEENFAKSLGLKVGDVLTFIIGGEPVSGAISSIRQLVWQNMQPNFYVLGNSSLLADYPSDLIVSFLVKQPEEVSSLVNRIPSINLIDLSSIIQLARTMTNLLIKIAIPFGIVTVIASILLAIAVYYGNKSQALILQDILNHLGLPKESWGVPLYEVLVICIIYSSCFFTQMLYIFINKAGWLPLPFASPFIKMMIIIVTFLTLFRLLIIKKRRLKNLFIKR